MLVPNNEIREFNPKKIPQARSEILGACPDFHTLRESKLWQSTKSKNPFVWDWGISRKVLRFASLAGFSRALF
jgi:hypothetical protein